MISIECSNSNTAVSSITGAAVAGTLPNVSVVSMSFGVNGGNEFSGEIGYDNLFQTPSGHIGVTWVGASGDNGANHLSYPPASPNVLDVGGTTLVLNADGSIASQTGWTGSGGGTSQYEFQPSYQSGVVPPSMTVGPFSGVPYRSTPDVAFVGDGNTGVAVYANGAWLTSTVGGTSLGSPCWAAMIALADQDRLTSYPAAGTLDGVNDTLPALYSAASYVFSDITVGYNDHGSFTNTGYYAMPGYDQVTGLGAPIASYLIPYLASYNVPSGNVIVGSGIPGQNGHSGPASPAPPVGLKSPSATINVAAPAVPVANAAVPQSGLLGALDWITTTSTAAPFTDPPNPLPQSSPLTPTSQTTPVAQGEPRIASLRSKLVLSDSIEIDRPSQSSVPETRALLATIDHLLAHELLSRGALTTDRADVDARPRRAAPVT